MNSKKDEILNEEEGIKSLSSFCPSDLVLTYQGLGSDSGWASSMTSEYSRRSRFNTAESSGTLSRNNRRKPRATFPKPFKLITEERGKSKKEAFLKQMKQVAKEEAKQRIPTARVIPFTTKIPKYLRKPPAKETTKPIDLVLHSDLRAEKRAEFEKKVAEKFTCFEQGKMELKRKQEEVEEEEVRRLRKESVPKARPMPLYGRPFIPIGTGKNPAIPEEPKFHIPQHKKMKSSGCTE